MPSLLDQLENRFGRLAIPGLIRGLVLLNALAYVLQLIEPTFAERMALLPAAVWQGEIWRVFTWIVLPRTYSPLWILFALWFLWFIADLLEDAWSHFRITLFCFSGWLLTTLSALLIPGAGLGPGANIFFNLTLFFAAATLRPDYEILLFFILPVKFKWLGLLSAIAPALLFLSLPFSGKLALLLSLANYLLFFAPALLRGLRAIPSAASARAPRRRKPAPDPSEALHACAICGRTELSHPDLEFRVSSDGHEYCLDHLPSRSNAPRPSPPANP